MRVTTNSMMRNYGSALSTSLGNRTSAMEKVYSGRKFTQAYKDPGGARRVAELNRDYYKTEVYISTVKDAQSRLDSAEGSLLQITSLLGETVGNETLAGMNGSNSLESRTAYAATLRELKQTLIQAANSTYQDSYLFAGADGENIPFTQNDDGSISYRGIDVTTLLSKADGTDASAKMAELAGENLYLDIGLGMKTTSGGVAYNQSDFNSASAFDSSLPGIKYFGYGQTADGISKNIFDLLGNMADELEKPVMDNDLFGKMRDQLKECHGNLSNYDAELGIKNNALENTKERLETNKLSIYNEIDSVINIQPETAIMDYSYAQYAYNMVLKVGSSLLTSSLIDFLK